MILPTLCGRRTLLAAAFLASVTPASAQDAAAIFGAVGPSGPELTLADGSIAQPGLFADCVLPAFHPDMLRAHGGDLPTPSSFDPNAPVTAVFEVTYIGFEDQPEAQAAFQRAVDIWSQHLASTVPIKVRANWTNLGNDGVLGSAGTNGRFRNLPNQPVANSWYSSALADAISGTDRWTTPPNNQPDAPDIITNFNSSFASWYFGVDGNTPSSRYDFVTVVLHELGHGLGFQGSARVTGTAPNTVGSHSEGGLPFIYDRFVEDQNGVAMLDAATYPNNSAELSAFLRSNNAFFDGPFSRATLAAASGLPPRIYAPTTWAQGSSYSHHNEQGFPPSDPNALMTPFVSNGESHDEPGPITCALFKDTGWPLSAMCEDDLIPPQVAAEPIPEARRAALDYAGPNPFGATTVLRLAVDAPQAVRAELYDVVGRRVATLFEGSVAAGVPVEFEVDGARLRPGVYVVRVTGETFAATQRIVRAD